MPMLRHLPSYLSIILLAGGTAHAAELGEARVTSHIGQPLVADVELAMVDDPAEAVQVRVASPEVYNGAGIAPPDVLPSLHLSTMRRGGRQFLHVTSLRPVDADHLHLYLELVDKGQRSVRLATLWLTPDPNPAPLPATAAATAPAGPVVAAPAVSVAEAAHVARAEVAHPAAAVRAVPVPKPQPEPRRVARPLLVADPLLAPKASPQTQSMPQPMLPARVSPVTPAAPATCARPQPDQAAQACMVLGEKNAELRAQLGRLEHKVQGLQASLGMDAPGAPPAAEHPAAEHPAVEHPVESPGPGHSVAEAPPPPAIHEPIGPKPINAIKPLVPRKPKVEPVDDGLPWAPIGAAAAVLAAVGALAAVLRRRRRAGNVDIPSEPGALARVLGRLRKRPAAQAPAADAPAVEPSFD